MKWFRAFGIMLGLTLVGVLVYQVGWASIAATLGTLGWKYVIVFIYPLSWITMNTAGTVEAFRRGVSKIPFVKLAEIRLAGETFNSLLPSGYVGGEPLKAKLIAQWMPLREATSAILIAKAAQSVALVFFLGFGLTLAGRHPSVAAPPSRAPWIALGLLSIGIFIFVRLLSRQAFSRLGKLFYRLTKFQWLLGQEVRLVALDETLGAFYREGKSRFAASVGWHLLGWLAGALEVKILFMLLGHAMTWQQAWFMGAMAQLASVIALIIPAGVGFYEGGHYLAAIVLGFPPSLGLSVSLIRRVREIFWDGVGITLFWRISKQKP